MYKDIIRLLDNRRLKEALTQMTVYAGRTADWQLKNEIETLHTSYHLMLQYASQGMKDPNKKRMYGEMIQTAYELTDRTLRTLEAAGGQGTYYDIVRTFAVRPPHTLAELQMQLETYTEDIATAPALYFDERERETQMDAMRKKHTEAIDELFDKVWTSAQWSEAELTEAIGMTESVMIAPADIAVMVSAVTMSLLHTFDARKFSFLIHTYRRGEVLTGQRALIGIALVCYYQQQRILLYPSATSALEALCEDPRFTAEMHRVQIQLLQSARETQKIDKKMREEIIPGMMKNPKLKRPRIGMEEAEDAEDSNPEWEEWIDKSGMADKLRELGEMQMAGADVYMSTFAQLKNFPFFRKVAHWFYPFDPQHPEVARLYGQYDEKSLSILDVLMKSDIFCNSDKYSFSLTLAQLPESQRQLMKQQLGMQADLSEEVKERIREIASSEVRAEFVTRQYIQDLYRFFKLWMKRYEMHDIFQDKLDLWNLPSLSSALRHRDYIGKLADYLFAHDYLDEAGILYGYSLENYTPNHAELWQKTGYIHQRQGHYEEAIRHYLQADLIDPDKEWNNRHLAQCYKKWGNYEKAVGYYKKVEQVQRDNLNLSLHIGQCLIELGRYDEALNYFYKVEYLSDKPQNARRALGWCLFITGKYGDAQKYYDKLTAEPQPIKEDWLNAGHVYYLLGETPRAIECYRKAQAMCESHEEFIALFRQDKEVLLEQGLEETDIYIVTDYINEE